MNPVYGRPRGKGPTRSKARGFAAGTLRVNANGTATVETAEGTYHISKANVHEAMNGDRVQVRALRGRYNSMPTGSVAGVLERAVSTFVAEYVEDGQLRVLVPLDDRLMHDFIVDVADDSPRKAGARDGDLVCARIACYPTRHSAGIATVVRPLGDNEGETVAIEAIIAAHDLRVGFPDAALEQARSLRLDVASALADPVRRDIRDRFVVTVDPDDARDFDDALSIEAFPDGGWLLGVHIADVSAYVPWGSPLDLEARERGTSTYLADRVLPMLPEELSCGLCSLNPGEDRLAVTVDLTLSASGRVVSAAMYPSVIRSRARFAYRQVDALLAGRPVDLPRIWCAPGEKAVGVAAPDGAAAFAGAALPAGAAAPDLAAFFGELDHVRRLREGLRRERGSIEFVSAEAKVVLDEDRRPVGVTVRHATPATKLVEEAMLAANEAVACRLTSAGVPAAFRVHEPPARESLVALVPVLTEIGCLAPEAKAGLICGDPHAVQAVLDAVYGKPEEELVSSLLLRAMRRAVYAPADDGHYGLGADAYCHFTSPIRRYPDLVVHRSLKALLAGGMKPRPRRELEYALPSICKHASQIERVAAAASYESQAVKLAEYMGGFLGQVFEGVVTSVQPFGLFVRLRETSAEGLLHVSELGPGPWDFDEARCELVCRTQEVRYRLGQSVEVRVRSVDAFRGKIDFAMP